MVRLIFGCLSLPVVNINTGYLVSFAAKCCSQVFQGLCSSPPPILFKAAQVGTFSIAPGKKWNYFNNKPGNHLVAYIELLGTTW